MTSELTHFIGIGGIGMSAIAEMMHNKGFAVQGSNLGMNANCRRLAGKGVQIFSEHSSENLGDANKIVVSTAIQSDNIELQEAQRRGLPILHRSDALVDLMADLKGISITGTHGKTTSTALTYTLLAAGGLSPSVLNGGIIHAVGSNSVAGKGDWLVVEADESDGSFTKFHSQIAVITNIDPEHMENYGDDMSKLLHEYEVFLANIADGGLAILCADHPETAKLAKKFGQNLKSANQNDMYTQYQRGIDGGISESVSKDGSKRGCKNSWEDSEDYSEDTSKCIQHTKALVTYGFAENATLRAKNVVQNGCQTSFELIVDECAGFQPPYKNEDIGKGEYWGKNEGEDLHGEKITLNLPGKHNVQNSLVAIAIALHLGVEMEVIKKALASFQGIARRFVNLGQLNGVTIIDDYGHHPVEIKATLEATCKAFTGDIVAVIQPHRYTRLNDLFEDFANCTEAADKVIITPVYEAGESPIDGINHHSLAVKMAKIRNKSLTQDTNFNQSKHCKNEPFNQKYDHDSNQTQNPALPLKMVYTVENLQELQQLLPTITKSGDTAVFLGAGDINLWAKKIQQSGDSSQLVANC